MIREFYADGDLDPNDTDYCYPDRPFQPKRFRGIAQVIQEANRENGSLTVDATHAIIYPEIDLIAGSINPRLN